MKKFRFLNAAIALLFAFSLSINVIPVQAHGNAAVLSDSKAEFVPGEVVVGFVPAANSLDLSVRANQVAKGFGAQVVRMGGYGGGTVLMRVSADVDVKALAARLRSQPGVAFAEPNYLYYLPKDVQLPQSVKTGAAQFQQNYILRSTAKSVEMGLANNKHKVAAPESKYKETVVPIAALQAMKTATNGPRAKTTATYPTDPYLFWGGWSSVGADIVWPNTTASAGICEIDTGVDYTHPDLSTSIIKGYDFVNGDADPMDDNGHGTHVAGIMVAAKNNGIGIAGVSTGSVVAVKALDAQGMGTSFDVAQAIFYCAGLTTVRVISMSLGGPESVAIDNSVSFAVNGVNPKLVVAAAGNDGTSDTTYAYPAALSITYPNKVLAVGASGYVFQDDPVNYPDNWSVDYSCQGGFYDTNSSSPTHYSNYGSWVSVVAPGTEIYSTTPWDKPFYLNYYEGVDTRYAYLTGTSMATPYVAATAARRWGYMHGETNDQIGQDVIASGGGDFNVDTSDWGGEVGTCWDSSMAGKNNDNVAAMLNRGALRGEAYNAQSGVPLNGATLTVYHAPNLTTVVGTGVVSPSTYKNYPGLPDPSRIYTSYTPEVDVLNLPVDCFGYWNYTAKVNLTGFTASPQPLWWWNDVCPGEWGGIGTAAVPPKSANFDVVTGWIGWNYDLDAPATLDSNVWLPQFPNSFGLLSGQPAEFLVGPEGDTSGYNEGDPTGGMTYFPFARLKRNGADGTYIEDLTIRNRFKAHDGLALNVALPYYPGTYAVNVTDNGQMSSGYPLLGWDASPSVFIWKDGLVKFSTWNYCNDHWWGALSIYSGVSGTGATYDDGWADCGSSSFGPYGP